MEGFRFQRLGTWDLGLCGLISSGTDDSGFPGLENFGLHGFRIFRIFRVLGFGFGALGLNGFGFYGFRIFRV